MEVLCGQLPHPLIHCVFHAVWLCVCVCVCCQITLVMPWKKARKLIKEDPRYKNFTESDHVRLHRAARKPHPLLYHVL